MIGGCSRHFTQRPGSKGALRSLMSGARFGRRIAWLDAGDAARLVLWVTLPVLVVATALAAAALSRRGPASGPTRSERPFQPSFRPAGFLGQELE